MRLDLTTMTQREWLEIDGLGGFASGTVSGIRTRRYHALLLAATTPPTGRVVLVNGFDAYFETLSDRFALTSQLYTPGVIHPDGAQRIIEFAHEPWPRWCFSLDENTRIEQEIFLAHGAPVVAIRWRLIGLPVMARLIVRPFLSGRDYHSLHHENPAFQFEPRIGAGSVAWQSYPGIPVIIARHNGEYRHQPEWYRNFSYTEERQRGLDYTEDLAAPGTFQFDLGDHEAVLMFAADGAGLLDERAAEEIYCETRNQEERRRRAFPSVIDRAADSYLVRRGNGKTILAGYPWFTDWGRDTFIALRGLCLAVSRLAEARDILLEWSGVVSYGMLPNRFPDGGEAPEYNSVDASLWYVIAVHNLFKATRRNSGLISQSQKESLQSAVDAILTGYSGGTRYGIHMDEDGLLAAGEPGVQLTWMDAKIGDWVVTPRIGKPVEIQALWLNALWIGGTFDRCWEGALSRGLENFLRRFWNSTSGGLYDVVDADHVAGKVEDAFRPNQILAVGGLPLAVVEGAAAKQIVDAVERRLWTPLGLRSLAPEEPGYIPRYDGGVRERDGAYHQGIVWPWLIGPFVEAWVRVNGNNAAAKRTARARFLEPFLTHLDEAGLGHVSEIADAEPPYMPRGCPFQAWSLAELLRLDRVVLS
jgi:predicted glycogen debranching enzyme